MTADASGLRIALLRNGFTPIPLFGKTPPAYGKNNPRKGLAQWQRIENVSYDQIAMYAKTWPDALNTGILTKYTPTLDADILDEAAARAVEDHIREFYDEAGRVLVRIGKPPKRAFLFRTEEPFPKLTANFAARNGMAEKLEFLASDQQVVVDGIHPDTGQPYAWFGGDLTTTPREELPYVREAEARDLIERLADLLVANYNYVRAADRPRKSKSNSRAAAASHSGGAADWLYLSDRIRAGESLHDSLRDLAAKLIKSGMNAGAAVNNLRALMESSGAARDERWRERFNEIPRLVDSAERFRNGNPPEPDEAAPVARTIKIAEPESANPDIYSVDALRTEVFPTLKKIAGDIIVEGLTLLASRPKIGKTWLALDVAIAVETNGYCLGDIQCEQGDVLFLALEDNKRRMQRRLTKLLGVNKVMWPRFACAHKWPRANAGGLKQIRDWIEQHKETARLVVIDVLARFRKPVPPGKQSYDADYETIAELQQIASDTGVAIVVIHHTRKGEADDPLDAVSGTLGLAGAADAVLVIDRNPQGTRLYGRSRDVDEIDKAMLFDKATCRWTILGETADVRRSEARQQILEALAAGPMALKDIAKRVGKATNTVFNLLEKMARSGEVIRTSFGHYARPATPDGSDGKV